MAKTRAVPKVRFGFREKKEARRLIRLALAEDATGRDVTTRALIPARTRVRGAFVAREDGVLCGIPVAALVFAALDPKVAVRPIHPDGARVHAGEPLLEVEGSGRSILTGERVTLNFLQRLSGIATATRRFEDLLAGSRARLLDTRKTIPGWRTLEKYAVRAGGGDNHRAGLADQALVKDNHIRILRAIGGGGAKEWVKAIRARSPGVAVEIEVETLPEFREAVEAGAEIILLDNMPLADVERAARELGARGRPGPLLEASGGIDARTLPEVAATGVDRISAGAITHSAVALDMAFDILEVNGEDIDS